MPFFWKIDSRERLVEIRAEGTISLADCLELAEVLDGARCLSYRKLLDGSSAQLELTDEQLMQVVVMVRSYHERGKVGPLAIVMAQERGARSGRLLGAFAAADRPLKLFTSERKARKWLAALP